MAPWTRAQGPQPAPTAVHLEVTAAGPLQERVTKCLVDELKALPDTVLSDGIAALTLSVIVVEQRMSDGEMIGYLVYEGGYQPGPQCAGGGGPDPNSRPVVVYWQTLRMLPPDLKKACRRIVSDFEAEVVDPTRASQREVLERMGAH